MHHQAVESSFIRSVAFDDGVLEVKLGGGTYAYFGATEEQFKELLEAGSKGSYFNSHLRGLPWEKR